LERLFLGISPLNGIKVVKHGKNKSWKQGSFQQGMGYKKEASGVLIEAVLETREEINSFEV
jgi:hypothetical protein